MGYKNGDEKPAPSGPKDIPLNKLYALRDAAEVKYKRAKELYDEDPTEAREINKKVAKAKFDAFQEACELFDYVAQPTEEEPAPELTPTGPTPGMPGEASPEAEQPEHPAVSAHDGHDATPEEVEAAGSEVGPGQWTGYPGGPATHHQGGSSSGTPGITGSSGSTHTTGGGTTSGGMSSGGGSTYGV